jgi:hypothetical protein
MELREKRRYYETAKVLLFPGLEAAHGTAATDPRCQYRCKRPLRSAALPCRFGIPVGLVGDIEIDKGGVTVCGEC